MELSLFLTMIVGSIIAMMFVTAPLWVDIMHERRERKANKSSPPDEQLKSDESK